MRDGNETAFRVNTLKKRNQAEVVMKKLECLKYTEDLRANAQEETFTFIRELGSQVDPEVIN